MTNLSSKLIQDMIEYFDGDVRRINHALKVYTFAKTIGELEGLKNDDMDIIETSAILHDIGIKVSEEKYNSSAGSYQEKEGPPEARRILSSYAVDKDFIERVCFIIGHHHSYLMIDRIDFQIIVEADFLVNIYEDQIDKDNIKIIKERYFKTKTGTKILENMYKM